MSDRETLENELHAREANPEEHDEEITAAIRGVLEENKRLRGLLEAQEKSRMSVEEWSQEKSRVIDRLTAQRDEALAAMNADTADVVLAKCVAESEVHRLEEENERLRAQVDTLTDVIERMGTAAEARIDAALAIFGEPVTPSDYGSFQVVRDQVSRAVKALKGVK